MSESHTAMIQRQRAERQALAAIHAEERAAMHKLERAAHRRQWADARKTTDGARMTTDYLRRAMSECETTCAQ